MAAIAVPVSDAAKPTGANGNNRDSVTGGGQMLDENPTGAGDTIAFQAQRERGADLATSAATGQIQVNRRGTNAVKFHGLVECMNTSGVPKSGAGYAYLSGQSKPTKANPTPIPFELYVSDGGKGAAERDDFIALFVGSETTANDDDDPDNGEGVCGFEEYDPTSAPELGRGNVQVRNRSTEEDADPAAPSAATTAALLALF
jgi:hypothetical protein